MSATLALIATALETAAGASTSTNPNEAGYWKRIAAAVESLAGATTSANDVPSGYMLRSALALESMAGTSGTEENSNYSGLLKRIVDALEVQSGVVEVGSLEHRLLLGAQNAVFTPEEPFGPNLITNSSCTAGGGGWSGTAFKNDRLEFAEDLATASQTVTGLEDGATYRLFINNRSYAGGNLRVTLTQSTPAVRFIAAGSTPVESDSVYGPGDGTALLTFTDSSEVVVGWIDDVELKKVNA